MAGPCASTAKTKTVEITYLKSDPHNARKHSPANIEAIRSSIRRFGQVEPLVVQKSSGMVIGGNARLEVLRTEGFKTVNIVEVDLDDKRASALGLALNRSGELAEWDETKLAEILRNIEDDVRLDLGWADDDLSAILAPAGTDGLTDPDDVPAPPDAATTVPGDIWVLGNHRLMCGDSAKPADLDRPAGNLSAADRSRFYNEHLDDRGRNTWERAERYYNAVIMGWSDQASEVVRRAKEEAGVSP